jgi:hypothetical protein
VTCTGAGRTASARATVVVTPSPPVIVIGGTSTRPVSVIGEITLQARAPAGEPVVYRLDGRRLNSPTFHTDYSAPGIHRAEADITTTTGNVIVKRLALNVIAP